MGGYTAVSSTVRFDDTDAMYSSVGLLFKLYNTHLGTIPLKLTGNSPQKPVKGTIGVDKPAEPSGSPTYPLDVFAARSADGRFVSVAVINPTDTDQELGLAFEGVRLKDEVQAFELVPPELSARNVPGDEPVIVLEEFTSALTEVVRIKPYGIALYKYDVQ
jgi:alpha-N-arabinofuranosidase